MNNTENERIWQWLDAHAQEVLDYWASKSRDASQVEQVAFDPERHSGMLMVYIWQGVVKVVSVSPQSLLEGMEGIGDDIRQLLIDAANEARTAAGNADEKAAYAQRKGDETGLIITDLEDLKALVRRQGETAESQGAYAETQGRLAKEISDYPPVWHEGFLWVYEPTANDPVMGKRRQTSITAVDFSTLSEQVRVAMMEEFLRANNAPSIEGSTLVFPANSTATYEGSTLVF
jgi:hypothetical protein